MVENTLFLCDGQYSYFGNQAYIIKEKNDTNVWREFSERLLKKHHVLISS